MADVNSRSVKKADGVSADLGQTGERNSKPSPTSEQLGAAPAAEWQFGTGQGRNDGLGQYVVKLAGIPSGLPGYESRKLSGQSSTGDKGLARPIGPDSRVDGTDDGGSDAAGPESRRLPANLTPNPHVTDLSAGGPKASGHEDDDTNSDRPNPARFGKDKVFGFAGSPGTDGEDQA